MHRAHARHQRQFPVAHAFRAGRAAFGCGIARRGAVRGVGKGAWGAFQERSGRHAVCGYGRKSHDGYALQPQRVDGGGGGHYEPGRQGARENGPLGTRRAAYRQKRSRRLRPENFRERRKIFPVKRAGEKAFAKRRTPFLAAF